MISAVMDTLGVSDLIARSLLLSLKWDSEVVIDRFINDENLLRKLFNFDGSSSDVSQKIQGQTYLCPCCYDEKQQTMTMDCGHRLCFDCYKDYLVNQLQTGPDSIYTTCPVAPCKLIVPEFLFKEVCNQE